MEERALDHDESEDEDGLVEDYSEISDDDDGNEEDEEE